MAKILRFPADGDEDAYRTMSFGKYEGWLLSDIPDSYLEWCIGGECESVNVNRALYESIKTRLICGPSVEDDEWEDRCRNNRRQ
jgi:hypothetical protein